MGMMTPKDHEGGGPIRAILFRTLVRSGIHKSGLLWKKSIGTPSGPGAFPACMSSMPPLLCLVKRILVHKAFPKLSRNGYLCQDLKQKYSHNERPMSPSLHLRLL